ncbi:hypothetical protein CS542_10110 [Pedobacter sp. IW39]|nr:hypothetical protein CS542_10110 [Pedobacter sp. IW39]
MSGTKCQLCSHLTEYYKQTRPDSALVYAGKMYEVAKKLNSPDDKIEALQNSIELGPQNKQKYFETYRTLDDVYKLP